MTQTAPKTVKWTRTLELTEKQEDVLVKMALHYLKTNDCNEVAKNDLDDLYKNMSDAEFLDEASNYWDDGFTEVIEEVEEYANCDFKKDRRDD